MLLQLAGCWFWNDDTLPRPGDSGTVTTLPAAPEPAPPIGEATLLDRINTTYHHVDLRWCRSTRADRFVPPAGF